jgi:prepilin-type N-terminal cleavage/methylation domain-containing protein
MFHDQRTSSAGRRGFTLIELLVVIAIIAILASLALVGLSLAFRMPAATQNRNDLLQIAKGLQDFKAKYGRYPLNRIRLRANYADYQKKVDPLDDASAGLLSTMWPNIAAAGPIAWAGATPMPANGIVLDCDQALVFCLGGPPIGGGQPGLQGGFSVNPYNPVDPATAKFKFMDFPASRLTNRGGNPFPSYLDAWGQQPIVFFSSQNPNGCDTTANSLGVMPYFEQAAPTRFYMPNSFQLIVAGADGQFGPGGLWTPSAAGSIAPAGRDDVANFYDKNLGVP